MNRNADWVAWVLQWIVGFVVGLIIALGGLKDATIPMSDTGTLAVSIGLIVAGLASYYGDELWFQGSYRVIPPDEIPHSQASKAASIATGLAGAVGLLFVYLKYVEV
jgi:hypothetical protein